MQFDYAHIRLGINNYLLVMFETGDGVVKNLNNIFKNMFA